MGFARQFPAAHVALMALVISGAYLIVGVGTELALGTFRPWSPDYRFAGTVHPNSQGAQLAIFCFGVVLSGAVGNARDELWLWTLFAVGLVFLC